MTPELIKFIKAAVENDLEEARTLFESCKDDRAAQERAMYGAARCGSLDVAKFLLANGVDLRRVKGPTGLSALHAACIAKKDTMVKWLVRHMGDVIDVKDRHGNTALSHAVYDGNLLSVKYLVDGGADVNGGGINGSKTNLHVAVNLKSYETTKLLLELGADDTSKCDYDMETPLHHACKHDDNSVDIVKVLSEYVEDVNVRNRFGETPLMLAATGMESPAEQKCRLLLSKGADVDAVCSTGRSAIGRAAFCRNAAVVRLLESSGAHVDQLTRRVILRYPDVFHEE